MISDSDNHNLYSIMNYFSKYSGIANFINIRFIGHEKLIVCAPDDALKALNSQHVDVVAFCPFVCGPTINSNFELYQTNGISP